MKLVIKVACKLLVTGICFFFSTTPLYAVNSGLKEQNSKKMLEIAELLPAATLEMVGPPVPAIKKKAAQPGKGVVYLPIVSLSSYVPIGAQILLMILTIALSGLFGAWLMFRELSKRVQVLQESMPQVQRATSFSESYQHAAVVPFTHDFGEQKVVPAPVKKRTLFVSKNRSNSVGKKAESPNEYTAKGRIGYPKSITKVHAKKTKSEPTKLDRMPKKFLINEWFPIDR